MEAKLFIGENRAAVRADYANATAGLNVVTHIERSIDNFEFRRSAVGDIAPDALGFMATGAKTGKVYTIFVVHE